MIYTTDELLNILDQELRATYQGERLLLSSENRLDNPVIAKAIGSEKLSRVYAYQDFRCQIHAYQQQHSVSGIIWRTCQFGGESLQYPELHNQLIAIPGDKEILMEAKSSVLAFWHQVTKNFQLWRVSKEYIPITPETVEDLAQKSEWAQIDAGMSEVYLSLCWGKPEECHYQWARDASGCEQIVGAIAEPTRLIKI